MALSSSIVWEIRNAGNANNGGGYKTGASGTDFSQQTSPQYALTGIATAGAGATFLTASAASDMVGNIAHVVSGTNFTAGFYEITSVSVGVSVTCDANVCTGVGASGVINIGGALKAIGTIGSNTANQGAVAGNTIWVKADSSYSQGANDTFSVVATAASPIKIAGYKTTRGDGYLGRNTTTDGKLITTNMPDYQYQATFRLIGTGSSFCIWESINFSVAGAGVSNPAATIGTSSIVTRCISTNPSTNTVAGGLSLGTAAVALDNDVFMTGASGGATGAGIIGSLCRAVIGNRVQMSQSTSTGPAINLIGGSTSASVLRNVVIGNGGSAGVYVGVTSASVVIDSNTIVNFVDGVGVITGSTGLNVFTNNLITDNTTNAINATDAGAAVYNAYNRLRDPITISGATNYTALSSQGNVTTDAAAYADYVNQAGGDYRLLAASPAVNAALPFSASMGALQRSQSSGGGGGSYAFGA